jgi:hypothetical protein
MQQMNQTAKSNDITVGELIAKLKSLWRFLLSKWLRIVIVGLTGSLIGLLYAWLTPVKYVSRMTFVVEESKGVGGGLSALAGQFGFDLGGSGGGGVFAGDNILLFLRSESLCRETLLTPYDDQGKVTLADRYAEARQFKRKWRKDEDIGEINFAPYAKGNLPRLEDSLLQIIIRKNLLVTDLLVAKPDKKASFIQVAVSTRDEKLSALFAERLVKIATIKYVESKTKLKAANVALLQRRADSLAALLNDKTIRAASSQQVLVDVNPALKTAPITAEISTREKSMIGTIFAEVVKNLEIAKSILSQETPAIQMVDQSTLPLEKVKASKAKAIIMWGVLFVFLYMSFLIASKWIKSQLQNI